MPIAHAYADLPHPFFQPGEASYRLFSSQRPYPMYHKRSSKAQLHLPSPISQYRSSWRNRWVLRAIVAHITPCLPSNEWRAISSMPVTRQDLDPHRLLGRNVPCGFPTARATSYGPRYFFLPRAQNRIEQGEKDQVLDLQSTLQRIVEGYDTSTNGDNHRCNDTMIMGQCSSKCPNVQGPKCQWQQLFALTVWAW